MSAGDRLRSETYPSAWAAALAGPLAWFLNLEAVYALTPLACASGSRAGLHFTTFGCLAIAAMGAGLAWFNWVWAARSNPSDAEEGWEARVGFLSLLGLGSAALFTLLILAQWIAILVLDPCSS